MSLLDNIYSKYPVFFDQNINNILLCDTDSNVIDINYLKQIYETDENYYHKKYIYLAILSYYITAIINNKKLDGSNIKQSGSSIINNKKEFINYKLNKYGNKFIQHQTSKYKQKYFNYLNKYNKYDFNFINTIINNDEYHQKGGEYISMSNTIVNNIIDKDQIKILPDYKLITISKSFDPVTQKLNLYMINNAFYNFKKYLKNFMTDTFMKVLSSDFRKGTTNNFLYNKLTYFVYIHINLALSQLIYLINKKKIYKNAIKEIDDTDIQLIYKGGNTIRIHLEYIKKKYNNLNEEINKLYTNKDIGDWDYSLVINYNSLSEKKYDINSLILKIKRTIDFSLYFIKSKLERILTADNIYNKYFSEIKTLLLDKKIEYAKSNYITKYNLYTDPQEHINNIIFKEILITNLNKKLKLDNKEYKIEDIDILLDNTKRKSFKDYEINHIDFTITNFKEEIEMIEYMELKENYIFITYINSIKLLFFTSLNDFSLFRLKLNNQLKYTEEKKDKNINKILNIPIELIDVSINSIYDNQISSLYYKHFLGKIDKLKLYNFNLLDDLIIEIEVPSILYMYYDIIVMLFQNHIFPWLESKYDKRLDRLCQLYVLNHLNVNNKECIYNISYFITFIDNIMLNLINKYKESIISANKSITLDIRHIINSNNIKFIKYINNLNINNNLQIELKDILINIYTDNIKECDIKNIEKNLNININDVHNTIIQNNISLKYIDINHCLSLNINEVILSNLDNELKVILSNLYLNIILLLYLLDYKLNINHKNYAKSMFKKYKNCSQSNICTNLKNDIFSFDTIKENKYKYISELVIYIINLKMKFSNSLILISSQDIETIDDVNIDSL